MPGPFSVLPIFLGKKPWKEEVEHVTLLYSFVPLAWVAFHLVEFQRQKRDALINITEGPGACSSNILMISPWLAIVSSS